MAEAARIEQEDRVLEIGTGSGYAAAVYANLAAEVFTVERVKELAEKARERLQARCPNVVVRSGDGTRGLAREGAIRRDRGCGRRARHSCFPAGAA